jgi:hypothetical protein
MKGKTDVSLYDDSAKGTCSEILHMCIEYSHKVETSDPNCLLSRLYVYICCQPRFSSL